MPRSSLYKIGIHPGGPPVDPDRQDQGPDEEQAGRLDRLARRYLPGLDPRPVRIESCIYDNTPDEDFVIDRAGQIVVGSGTSGHGFKFGPLLGEWLADLAAGLPPAAPWPSFAPRFAMRAGSLADRGWPRAARLADQLREGDDIAQVVAGRRVEGATAGDQAQLRVRNRPVHRRGGKPGLRIQVHRSDPEHRQRPVGPPDIDPVTRMQEP